MIERLNIRSLDQLRALIIEALQNPNETYEDIHGNIFYLLRRNNYMVCVVVHRDRVRTAYLLGPSRYMRMSGEDGGEESFKGPCS